MKKKTMQLLLLLDLLISATLLAVGVIPNLSIVEPSIINPDTTVLSTLTLSDLETVFAFTGVAIAACLLFSSFGKKKH